MIDNPLENQVMEEKDNEYLSEQFYEHCKDKAIEICKEFDVDESFYDLFTEWFSNMYSSRSIQRRSRSRDKLPSMIHRVTRTVFVFLTRAWWCRG